MKISTIKNPIAHERKPEFDDARFAALDAAFAEAACLPAVRVRGLMAIPPICEKPEDNRPFFLQMQKLFIDNCGKKYDNISMDFLSMGMSGDYSEAVRCGANMVRIGSGIFGPRNYTLS